jgi:transposase InsO family protein
VISSSCRSIPERPHRSLCHLQIICRSHRRLCLGWRLVRQPEDVGTPAAPGHPGGAAHSRTDHAGHRLARGDPCSPRAAHHRARPGRGPGTCPGGPALARVTAPNLLVVADFTDVPMVCGLGYTASVVDVYAGLIPGWECSLRKDTGFVERALRQAAAYRARQGHPLDDAIHHSDAGSQYTAIHYSETLMLEGLIPSIGTVGDALDNGLCETTIGLYKTECVREGSCSAPARSAPSPTWRTAPRRGWPGTTSAGSCTGSGAAHPRKPRPSTTLDSTPESTPVTRNRVCIKPGMLHSAI